MLPLVNTVAVLQTVSMSFLAPYAELNYKKHLADAKEWVAEEKNVKTMHAPKRVKISTMLCNLLNTRLIRFSLRMDKLPLPLSVSV